MLGALKKGGGRWGGSRAGPARGFPAPIGTAGRADRVAHFFTNGGRPPRSRSGEETTLYARPA